MIVFFILLAAIAVCVIDLLIYQRHRAYVMQNSVLLEHAKQVNDTYRFYSDFQTLSLTNSYDNENFYRSILCKDYLTYQLRFIIPRVRTEMRYAEENSQLYEKYRNEYENLGNGGNYKVPSKWSIKSLLDKIEKQEYTKMEHHPITVYVIHVVLTLNNVNGSYRDDKDQYFTATEVKELIKRVQNRNGAFYNDREIWDAICRVERGKVTNRMRFAVYKRDGYRCRCCGRSQNSAYLEVDHIVPIAKGGKSTFNNLQTLCHDCNVKKGTQIWF